MEPLGEVSISVPPPLAVGLVAVNLTGTDVTAAVAFTRAGDLDWALVLCPGRSAAIAYEVEGTLLGGGSTLCQDLVNLRHII